MQTHENQGLFGKGLRDNFIDINPLPDNKF